MGVGYGEVDCVAGGEGGGSVVEGCVGCSRVEGFGAGGEVDLEG